MTDLGKKNVYIIFFYLETVFFVYLCKKIISAYED